MNSTGGRTSAVGLNGMVATPHQLASEVGLAVLKDGGSAVDAVIAANAVLTVVYPDQTSIGGDCFLMHFDGKSGEMTALNGSGRSAALANLEYLQQQESQQIPQRSIHAVTVPGTIDAWYAASRRFGRWEMARLLQPAVEIAANGFEITPNLASGLDKASRDPNLNEQFRATYLPRGAAPAAGSRMALPELAASLQSIGREGREWFYEGPVAEAINAVSQQLGGFLTLDDLAAHRAEWVNPISSIYRDVTVLEFPPNSQGLTAQIALNILDQQTPQTFGSGVSIHLHVEAKKLAFQVRDRELTDPAFRTIDTELLVSKQYAAALSQSYDADMAMATAPAMSGDTVYLCAIDADGNAASMIQSIYLDFGSGILAGNTGVLLQCRGAYFSLDPDHPNRLEGGKRTLHTLMPGMLLRGPHLWGPFGTQGGDAQAQVHQQLVCDIVDLQMEPQAAIDAPRWISGHRSSPDPYLLMLENRFDPSIDQELNRRGHHVMRVDDFDPGFGHAQMILRDDKSGSLRGGADPRAAGLAIGY